MNRLSRLFHRSCKHEIYYMYISYLINLIIINIFLMLATGINEIQNETLSQNDISQLRSIISSILLVSILTIAFFQWIISMQIQALYHRRNQFNINIRLIGLNKENLSRLYLQEVLFMQIVVIPLGIIISEIVYRGIAFVLHLNEKIIPARQLVVAIVIHLVVIILSVFITILKLTRRGIAIQLRETTGMESLPGKKKMSVYFILGTILLCLSFVLGNMTTMRQLSWMSKLIIFLSFFFFYDFIMFFFNKIICHVAE